MDLIEIFNQLSITNKSLLSVLIIILISLIKIPKIEINIWQLIAEKLGKHLNKDILNDIKILNSNVETLNKKVEDLEQTFDNHICETKTESIRDIRRRILRFDDEIIQGKYHSREHFNEIVNDIDEYEKYCIEHPEYPNNKAVIAITNIKNQYLIDLDKQKEINSK